MISASTGEQYAEPVAAIYRDAELRILRAITDSLADGLDSPEWEQLQLARIQSVRQQVLAELEAVNPLAAAELRASLDAAYSSGTASAYADVAEHLDPVQVPTAQSRAAVRALAAEASNALLSAQNGILRSTDDVYRSIVSRASASVLAGSTGRREATQLAINEFLAKGLPGIQTKRGVMDISTYTNMAVRTATSRASIQGHIDANAAMDLDLLTIKPGPRPCKYCDAVAGKVLSNSGQAGTITVDSLVDGTPITIKVWGSIADARAAGWGHPNDRCNLASYMPGVTTAKSLERPPWDQAGYEAQQQQRANERQIRAWKTREATAITPQAQADAKREIANWQKIQRQHMEAHPDLKRQSAREQISGPQSGNAARARPARGGSPAPRPAKAPPRPPSTTPKLDKLPRLKTPQTVAQATKGLTANPGKALADSNYGVNCSYVVNAVELRARGFDVIARPLPAKYNGGGRNTTAIEQDWRKADGTAPSFEMSKGGQRALEATMADWPEGARGFVVIQWKGGGAHIFNAERVNGKIEYREGQTDRSTDVGKTYFDRRKPGSYMGAMRVDHLTPTDALDDAVMDPTGPDAAKIREAAEAKAAAEARASSTEVVRAKLQKRIDELTRKIEGAIDRKLAAEGSGDTERANSADEFRKSAQAARSKLYADLEALK